LELVKILRELSRRRRLVYLVLGTSILVGFFLAFRPGLPPKSRQYKVSLASAEILIDTRDSQVAAVAGKGPDLPTLAGRANLMGNLMTQGPLKDAIARSAGVPPSRITVVPPANTNTPGVPPVPVTTPESRGIPDSEAIILDLSSDETLPILRVTAQAPEAETAERLSRGTIIQLRRYVGSVAASQDIRKADRLVIRQFGEPVAQTVTRGLPRRFALAATILIALLGCGAIVGGSWFIRSWRQIEEAEVLGHSGEKEGEESAAQIPQDVQGDLARIERRRLSVDP
jgi:hypothetical protein